MSSREPFIAFEVADASGAAVQAILHTHVAYESLRRLRLSWVHVLAVLGGLMTLTLAFPSVCPRWLATNLPLAWTLCCVGTCVTALRERIWARRRERLLAENPIVGDDA
jgi:hypothetical protein